MSRQFKVAIVVDHPLRDLPSCTLVGAYLAKAGIDVHLVPMNWQSREIFALAPDLVLLNYVRKNNELLIEKMIDAGIQYGMLDTEGGFYGDLQKYTRLLSSKRNVIEGIRINCVWGDVFFKMWRDDIGVKEETLFLTGLPRFDFYAPEWGSQVIKWLPESWQDSQPLFLLNTKVAIANPQFSTTEQELKMYRDVFKLPEEEIQRHLKLGRASIEQNCQLARDLASDFTNSRVLIRPHPHERVATYSEKIGGNRPNLSADCSGAVVPWIVRSSALIHRQCTTAVESAIAGVPAIAPQWIATAAEAPDAELVSHSCSTYSELTELLKLSIEKKLTPTPAIEMELQRIIDKWLYRVDGKSGSRVANAVLSIAGEYAKVNYDKCKKYLHGAYDHRQDITGKLYKAFSRTAQKLSLHSVIWASEAGRQRQWQSSGKSFSNGTVQPYLDNFLPHVGVALKAESTVGLDDYPLLSVKIST